MFYQMDMLRQLRKHYVHWEHFIRTSGNPAPTRSHSRYPKFSPSHSCPCCSVTKSCPTVQPHDCSMPGLPVFHCLPELAQTHVHGVSGAIQPSHSLSPPYPFAFSLSQHQGLFQWVSSSHQVAKVLELQLQHQSFQWTFKVDSLWDGLDGSPGSPRDSQESSPIHSLKASILQCLAFFTVQLLYPFMTIGKTIALTRWTLVCKVMSLLCNTLSRFVKPFLPRSKGLNLLSFSKICLSGTFHWKKSYTIRGHLCLASFTELWVFGVVLL